MGISYVQKTTKQVCCTKKGQSGQSSKHAFSLEGIPVDRFYHLVTRQLTPYLNNGDQVVWYTGGVGSLKRGKNAWLGRAGFSIIQVLVAFALLGILVAVINQMMTVLNRSLQGGSNQRDLIDFDRNITQILGDANHCRCSLTTPVATPLVFNIPVAPGTSTVAVNQLAYFDQACNPLPGLGIVGAAGTNLPTSPEWNLTTSQITNISAVDPGQTIYAGTYSYTVTRVGASTAIGSPVMSGSFQMQFSATPNVPLVGQATLTNCIINPTNIPETKWQLNFASVNRYLLQNRINNSANITLQMNDGTFFTNTPGSAFPVVTVAPLGLRVDFNVAGNYDGSPVDTADTWYYLYAVPNAADNGAFRPMISINPPINGVGPTGFPVWKFLGALYNNTSGDIMAMSGVGNRYVYRTDISPNPGPPLQETILTSAIDVNSQTAPMRWVPPTARLAILRVGAQNAAAVGNLAVYVGPRGTTTLGAGTSALLTGFTIPPGQTLYEYIEVPVFQLLSWIGAPPNCSILGGTAIPTCHAVTFFTNAGTIGAGSSTYVRVAGWEDNWVYN